MMYATMLIISAVITVVGGAMSIGVSGGDLPLLAFLVPALFWIQSGGVAVWFLLAGMAGFGLLLPLQPVSLSLSMWMILPALCLVFKHRHSWQVAALILSVVAAMECGLVALQGEEKLGGSAIYTLLQIGCVFLVWISITFWKPVEKINWWPILLLCALAVGGWDQGALLGLCISALLLIVQELRKVDSGWAERLVVLLPAIAFATIVVSPRFTVPNPVFVAWLLILAIAWLGEYLLAPNDEEAP